MARRPLDTEGAALWARVLDSVRPLPGRKRPAVPVEPPAPQSRPAKPIPLPPVQTAAPSDRRHGTGTTLDGTWDRRLDRGQIVPDSTIDLHGNTLHSAYLRLDRALEQAIAAGDRVLLIVTGKPPRPGSERPHARGAIREAIGDWIAGSRHARSIAAVRSAHPRHGGAGALYIIIRRNRSVAAKES